MTSTEKYLTHLQSVFRQEPEFFIEKSLQERVPGVSSLIFNHKPESEMMTAITYGLSLGKHPDWTLGRPELILSVESQEKAWTQIAGYVANQLRGKCPFNYGLTINFGNKIAPDSDMDAFLIFAPATLDKEDYLKIDVGLEYSINIAGLYPIYSSEILFIKSEGLERFWKHPNFDLFNVKRNPIL